MANKVQLKKQSQTAVRTTVSVPTKDYSELERIAKEKKVSVAWVVREAIETFLTTKPTVRSK